MFTDFPPIPHPEISRHKHAGPLIVQLVWNGDATPEALSLGGFREFGPFQSVWLWADTLKGRNMTVFYGKTLDRSKWFLDGAVGPVATYTSPDFRQEAKVHFDGDYDRLERTAPLLSEKEILTRAHIVEAVSYYD